MKAHIGVDAQSGLVHTVIGTAANVSDVTQAGALLHGNETVAFGDAGYRGVHKREEAKRPQWHVAMQPGKRRQLDLTSKWAQLLEQAEQFKASVRAKVEHPFHVIKNGLATGRSATKGWRRTRRSSSLCSAWPPRYRQEAVVGRACPRCVLNTQAKPRQGPKRPAETQWIIWSFVLYFVAGACWIPVVAIPIRMRRLAEEAAARGEPLPDRYRRYLRVWVALGLPAYFALVVVLVAKPA